MDQNFQPPVIVVFESDLMVQVRFENEIRGEDFTILFISDTSGLKFGENSKGIENSLIEFLSREPVALILMNLQNIEIPWKIWVPLIKTDPATRRIPLVCYGSHVDHESLNFASQIGADRVFARSKMMSEAKKIIKDWVFIRTPDQYVQSCKEKLSDLAIKGLQAFNQRKYFLSHEYLEEAWNVEKGEGREIYRALLQVAVAYYQVERHNYRGAIKMFMRLRQWLNPLPDFCRGVNLRAVKENVSKVYEIVISLGQEGLSRFDANEFCIIEFENQTLDD